MEKREIKNMKKDIKVKLPEENVEYTFVFPGNIFRTYIFVCQRGDDRVVLMNTKTKQFTNMTPGWFAKMRRRQLISAKPTEDYKAPEPKEKGPVVEKASDYEKRIIQELRSLTPMEALSIKAKVGRHPEEIANDLERISNDKEERFSQEFVNRVFKEMTVARGCYIKSQGSFGVRLFN